MKKPAKERVRKKPRDFSVRTHRLLIGTLGFLLPWLLLVMNKLRPTQGVPDSAILPSVSAYYYTGGVAVFTGVLFAMALFLFTYRGYKGDRLDRVLGKLAAVTALGVALFPTGAPAGAIEPSWWKPFMGKAHYVSAVILFLTFAVFAIRLFRKSAVPERKDRPLEKRIRDDICLACGIGICIFIVWAGSSVVTHKPIFWPETLAIMAFAISWLSKGEVHRSPGEAIRWLRTRHVE